MSEKDLGVTGQPAPPTPLKFLKLAYCEKCGGLFLVDTDTPPATAVCQRCEQVANPPDHTRKPTPPERKHEPMMAVMEWDGQTHAVYVGDLRILTTAMKDFAELVKGVINCAIYEGEERGRAGFTNKSEHSGTIEAAAQPLGTCIGAPDCFGFPGGRDHTTNCARFRPAQAAPPSLTAPTSNCAWEKAGYPCNCPAKASLTAEELAPLLTVERFPNKPAL